MAAPGYVKAGTGTTDATGGWTHTCFTPAAAGNIIFLVVVQDGNTASQVTLTSITNAENLAGTDNTLTKMPGSNADGSSPIGDPDSARLHVWIGRTLSTSAPVVTGGNAGSEDVYVRSYEFNSASTGTTLATVIENGSAGAITEGQLTSSVGLVGSVTTLGSDRRYICFLGCDDDASIGTISGDSPAVLGTANESYSDAGGTDGAQYMWHTLMSTASTQTGGTGTSTPSAGWGYQAFALIGTTVDAVVPRHPGINHQNPGLLMKGLRRAWHRRRSGIFVPDLWVPEGAI